MQRVLSGIQPSGPLHIGNYFGALQNFVELQEKYEAFFMVADLHALTVPHTPEELREQVRHVMRMFLAIGLDPKKSTLFVQSQVPQHTELATILATIAPVGELERMTQFKEKSAQHKKSVNAGLLNYPVLQAADILLYNTAVVPVGDDQLQHLELARTLARKFNTQFGKTFVEPKALLKENAERIRSLQDPTKKMSKTLGPQHSVFIQDGENVIRDKVKRAVTDSESTIAYDPDKRPAVSNLVDIFALASGISRDEVVEKYKGKGYADFKKDLGGALVERLAPIQKAYSSLSDAEVDAAFKKGTEHAEKEAEKTMQVVRKKVGLT